MTVFVYAPTEAIAAAWARSVGLHVDDIHVHDGRGPAIFGTLYADEDRVVVVGEVDQRVEDAVRRNLAKCSTRPTVSRIAWPAAVRETTDIKAALGAS